MAGVRTVREAGGAAKARLLLMDGHAYAYRAFHAIRSLRNPQGEPTNAIFGFIKMLDRMRSWYQPTHTAVAWDGGLAAERMTLLPQYKAQRPEMPSDLEVQMDGICDFLTAQGIEDELPLWADDPAWAAWAQVDVTSAIGAGLRFRPIDDTVAATLAHTQPVPGIGLEPEREAEIIAAWHGR